MTSDFKQPFIIVITVGVNYDIVDMLWKNIVASSLSWTF